MMGVSGPLGVESGRPNLVDICSRCGSRGRLHLHDQPDQIGGVGELTRDDQYMGEV